MLDDMRYTLRSLGRAKGYAATAILTVALAVGLSTAVFSVVHGVLFAPLPYPEPDRLAVIWKEFPAYPRGPMSPRELTELRRHVPLFEQIAGIWPISGTLVTGGPPEPIRIGRVTSNFLEVLGVPPARGRWLNVDDEAAGTSNIVISDGLWRTRFGGTEVIGRRVRIDGAWGFGGGDYTIVGVMPPRFEMLYPRDATVPRSVEVWVPYQGNWTAGGGSALRVVGRVGAGVALTHAQQQVTSATSGPPFPRPMHAVSLHADVVRETRLPLLAIQGAVTFVVLVAALGIACLMLVRAQGRRREMGIRAAVGASPRRLARLLVIESVVLSAAGGAGGVALAFVGVRLLPLLHAEALPRGGIGVSAPVLVFSLLACVVTALIFGLALLVDLRRDRTAAILSRDGRGGLDPRSQRLRGALVVAELAFSVALLIGAGLLVRTFVNLQRVDPGFRTEGVLTFRLPLPFERFGSPEGVARFILQMERELKEIPGVLAAGSTNLLPLDDEPNYAGGFRSPEQVVDSGAVPLADYRLVSPGYFEAMGARLVEGRWFTDQDDHTRPLKVVIDDRLARAVWPGQSAVGKQLLLTVDGGGGEVVGVIRHLRHHLVGEERREQVFMPVAQQTRNQLGFVVRTRNDPLDMVNAIRRRISTLDPNLAPGHVRTLDALADRSRAPARFSMMLAALFAVLALLIAAVSLYGVISYSVAQRTAELGVRAALGADRARLILHVARQAALLAAAGIAIGLLGAVAMAGWMRNLLYGVQAFDPLIWLVVPLVVGLVAIAASYGPARRASRIDPAIVLRSQ